MFSYMVSPLSALKGLINGGFFSPKSVLMLSLIFLWHLKSYLVWNLYHYVYTFRRDFWGENRRSTEQNERNVIIIFKSNKFDNTSHDTFWVTVLKETWI
jgi:hypothetical protein